ncbi:MAG TPA: SH3 domain-containing protein [Anaerolineae bacterium]|nr:SH3 domain-containing protein [Anaerolineae bacterium]
MRCGHLLRLGTCLAPVILFLLARPSLILAENPPRVFAFYYAWYDDQIWSPNRVPDMPAQPYVSSDSGAIARQIDQAHSAGIDAFVVSWLGPGNPTDDRFKTILDIAGGKGFSATIDFEVERYGSRDAVIHALSYVRDALEPHGAFARVNGKPILFFWREQLRSVDDWAAIRNAVDPNHNQIWIAEGVNIAYQRAFDGHHLYSIAWSPDVNYTLNDWSRRVRRAGDDKLWVATVMPGYDDTRTTRSDKFSRPRSNGDFYRNTWRAALNSKPDLLVVNSFNEWVEGSMIEPSVSYGNLYLDITREYAAQFKAQAPLSADEKLALAAPPTPRPTRQATLAPTRGPTPAPSPTPVDFAAYRTTDALRVRSGPGTQYDMIAKVPANFVLDVLARSEDSQWLAIAYPDAGSLGWVSAEFVTPREGFDQFPIEPAVSSQNSPTPSDNALPDWY